MLYPGTGHARQSAGIGVTDTLQYGFRTIIPLLRLPARQGRPNLERAGPPSLGSPAGKGMRILNIGRLVLVLVLVLAPARARAGGRAGGIYAKGMLNHTQAHQAYLEAEWKTLTRDLEKFLADPRRRADYVDSVFAYKYLAVMYAADARTSRQAEAHFRRLLALAPAVDTADLRNLYASPEAMALFRRLREEYPREIRATAAKAGPSPETEVPVPGGKGGAGAEARVRRNWMYWGAAAGAAAAVMGALIYVSVSGPQEPARTRIPVDL